MNEPSTTYSAIKSREWREKNREKYLAKKKKYRLLHKEEIRQRRRYDALRANYGMTVEDYNELLEKQDGRCAICGTTNPGGNRHSKHFHVDHDHDTGAIRGLLCCECNRGLGILGDKIENIERVLAYLIRHKENNVFTDYSA